MTLTELHTAFEFHLRLKRRSSATLAYYRNTRRSLDTFLLTLDQHNPEVGEITLSRLRQFVGWLEERGLGQGGIHAHVRAVRALFGWATKEELLDKNPAGRLELPTLSLERQVSILPEQVKTLLEAARDGDQPLRDRAVLLTLFDTGVRVSELVGLCLDDLHFERGLMTVRGKGNKQRPVPIGARAMDALVRYQRRERQPKHAGVKHVLLSRHGTSLTRSGVGIRLEHLAECCGLGGEHLSPHTFRRGFAVEFLRGGGDVFTLQQILGHTSLEMTRRYVSFLDEDLKSAHLRFSPVDRM